MIVFMVRMSRLFPASTLLRRTVLVLFVMAGLVFIVSGSALFAVTPSYCASLPRLQWLSAEEVGSRLKVHGFDLVRLRLANDKCYQVVVRDSGGRLRDFLIHPVTADIVRDRTP